MRMWGMGYSGKYSRKFHWRQKMTNDKTEKSLEKTIWRVIPVEAHEKSFADQMMILSQNFRFDGGRSAYAMPQPKTDFEKEIYSQFQGLIQSYDIARREYVVPLIKELVIDNKQNEAALIFRYQMDFAIGKGFQMKEIVFHGKKSEKLKEIYEDHLWTGASSLDSAFKYEFSAKLHLDPMLYLLKGNVFIQDVDLHNLDMDKKQISFFSADRKKIQIGKK